jgi:hypothetical protein
VGAGAGAGAGAAARQRTGLVLGSPPPRPQFYLGAPGSGAPFHAHRDAVNALVYGRKQWYLSPPPQALYSTQPAAEWAAERLGEKARPPEHLFMCVQEAGDVLFVPHGWGHAALNLNTSVGVAIEFAGVGEAGTEDEEDEEALALARIAHKQGKKRKV